MGVEDVVFNFISFDELVKLTALLATVLQLRHFHLIVNFGHFCNILRYWLDADISIALLRSVLIVLRVSAQNSAFLSLLKHVSWAHLDAFELARDFFFKTCNHFIL